MWMRFQPTIRMMSRWIEERRIGEVCAVRADFGFRPRPNSKKRLLDPALGGGALLDIGIYPIYFAATVFGCPPLQVKATGHIGPTGIDDDNAVILDYPGGATAMLRSSFRYSPVQEGHVHGSEGGIVVAAPFHCSLTVTLTREHQEPHVFSSPGGLEHEARAVTDCVREGHTECPLVPLDESAAIAGIMDRIRAQIGLRYDADN
jgi:predicted dehydrogenase